MDTAYCWPQGIGFVKPMEAGSNSMLEKRPKPHRERVLNCPRCHSTNTKFCYFNNYSFSQPRYFCKTCRRYWTEGGSLRNVPVGGGSRKNMKPSSTSSSSSSSSSGLSMNLTDLNKPCFPQNPNSKIHEYQYLKLAYPPNYTDQNTISLMPVAASNSYANESEIYPSGFPLQVPKPTLDFTSVGFESSNGARLLFPLKEIKPQVSNSIDFELNRGQAQGESTGYWTRLLGGGSCQIK